MPAAANANSDGTRSFAKSVLAKHKDIICELILKFWIFMRCAAQYFIIMVDENVFLTFVMACFLIHFHISIYICFLQFNIKFCFCFREILR